LTSQRSTVTISSVPPETPYTIADLARLTGVTPRTVRYYVAQGLLPGPDATGRGAHYDEGHLARLRLTRRLQRQHLPLAEIRARLSTMTDDEVASLASTDSAPAPPSTSALDYIRTVLGGVETTASQPAPSAVSVAEPPGTPLYLRTMVDASSLTSPESPALPVTAPAPTTPAPATAPSGGAPAAPTTQPPEPPSLERSQWERLSLGPNVELHIRRPLSRHEQRRIDRLITIARQVLKEEQQ
jgi:DNA-binding transcriptional MerR regulator